MQANQVRLALLCGLCPNRRVLRHLTLWPRADRAANPVVVLVETKHRKQRPSVETRRLTTAPGQPRQWRCRKGHRWSLGAQELLEACLAAVEAGRREITAGVEVAGRRP